MQIGAERRGSRRALRRSEGSILFRGARRLTGSKAYGAENQITEHEDPAL